MKLALAIIVKDQVDDVRRILTDYSQYFDEIHIAPDARVDEFSALMDLEPKLFVHPYTWQNDFAHKRNFLASRIQADYYFRMDTDDSLRHPEKIREVAQKAMDSDISVVYAFYEYSKDEWGNTNAAHYRETIIKCSDNLFWNKKIHENIIPKNIKNHKVVLDDSFVIVHRVDNEHSYESAMRNIKFLLDEYNENPKDCDPRTLAYLGRNLLAVGDLEKSRFFLMEHIEKSGWDEDRYMSWCQLADLYKNKQEYKLAKSCCTEAIVEREDYPDAYFKLHDIFMEEQNWKKAIYWGKLGMEREIPKTVMVYDPSAYTWRPWMSMAYCYFMTGEYEVALALFNAAKKKVPGLDFIKNNEAMFQNAVDDKKFVDHFIWIINYMKDKAPNNIPSLLQSLPEILNDNAFIQTLKNKMLPSKVWDKDSIVIFCGAVLEAWSDKSIDGGIGGSEEAVIYLSQALTKIGKKVTVYNECGEDEGTRDGVTYINYRRFNPRDQFQTFIAWRSTTVFNFVKKAHNKWVWLHDVAPTMDITKEDIAMVDKFIVLSEYHKTLLPEIVPQSKIMVSSNGVNKEDFKNLTHEHIPTRCIYASSYDRGLERLLEIWPDVIHEVPNAELHIYYGWNNVDKLISSNPNLKKFKDRMIGLLHQKGVFEHGRLGHKELLAEYAKAGIYAYPCLFKEISCIAAMKAQESKCVPVTTNYAALAETVQSGIKVNGTTDDKAVLEIYKNELIGLLKDPDRQNRLRAEIDVNFSWDKVAKQWTDAIDSSEGRVFIEDRFQWIKSQCSQDDKIVDIGGNDGHTFEDWNRNNVTTVDIDLYDIPNFIRADAKAIPVADKTFDVAVLAEILEHVPDPIAVLKEAGRIANRIIVTVPEEHEWEEDLMPMISLTEREKVEQSDRYTMAKVGNPKCKEFYTEDNLEHLWHVRHYDKESLTEHFKLAGFTDFKIEKMVMGKWVFYGATING